MRDDDDRDTLSDLLVQEREDLVRIGGIQISGGLVGQDHVRARDDRARKRETLPLPAGQQTPERRRAVRETDSCKDVVCETVAVLARHASRDQRELEVLAHRAVTEDVAVLKHEPDGACP
ncbi:hypothetical protein GCM10023221_27000 [Luteimicrobium xylanilyticum]